MAEKFRLTVHDYVQPQEKTPRRNYKQLPSRHGRVAQLNYIFEVKEHGKFDMGRKYILTRSKSNEDIKDVDEIGDVVETDPEGTVRNLEMRQHGAPDDQRQVVDSCQRDDGKPAVVQVTRRVDRPLAKPPDIDANITPTVRSITSK